MRTSIFKGSHLKVYSLSLSLSLARSLALPFAYQSSLRKYFGKYKHTSYQIHQTLWPASGYNNNSIGTDQDNSSNPTISNTSRLEQTFYYLRCALAKRRKPRNWEGQSTDMESHFGKYVCFFHTSLPKSGILAKENSRHCILYFFLFPQSDNAQGKFTTPLYLVYFSLYSPNQEFWQRKINDTLYSEILTKENWPALCVYWYFAPNQEFWPRKVQDTLYLVYLIAPMKNSGQEKFIVPCCFFCILYRPKSGILNKDNWILPSPLFYLFIYTLLPQSDIDQGKIQPLWPAESQLRQSHCPAS